MTTSAAPSPPGQETATDKREREPTDKTNLDDFQAFRVWVNQPLYTEDPKPWKCLAMFYFLSDCLDYIAGLQDISADCVFQSPADCRHVKATDRRVVYKPQ